MNLRVNTGYCFLRLMLALVFVCFAGATSLSAQSDSCERPGGKRGDGDDLKCRMGVLLEKQQAFLEKSKAHMEQRCTEGTQCEKLKKNMDRAQAKRGRAANAHGRSTAKDYEDLTVKGNGKRKKKDGGNSSASEGPTTQAQEGEEEEPQPDPAIGEDLAADLDEVIEAVDDANEALDAEPAGDTALLGLNQSSSPKFEASYGYGRSERTGAGWAMAAFVAFRVSHTLAEVSDKFCDQTVVVGGFGGNFSTGCAVFFWAAQVFEHIHETLGFLDDDIDSAEIEGAYERAGQVYDKVSELQVSTGNTETQIGALQSDLATHDAGVRDLLADVMAEIAENQQHLKKVMAVQRQIIRILLQPPGKGTVNPDVLTCTGDNCPVVLACPGNECASPVK